MKSAPSFDLKTFVSLTIIIIGVSLVNCANNENKFTVNVKVEHDLDKTSQIYQDNLEERQIISFITKVCYFLP